MTSASRVLGTLALPALLLACETEPRVVGPISASHASTFSAWPEPVSLGPTINSAFNDQQAALSKDGLSLYFASNRPGTPGPGPNDIWVSNRDCLDCPWSEPANVGAPVNTGSNDAAPALSRDGHWLFFLSNRPGSAATDVWAARRQDVHDDLAWETAVNLGAGVNAAGFDGGPAYFENDDVGVPQLFFNRSPGPAPTGSDIYLSEQAADGSFGPAIPVAELNSPSSEQRPSVAPSGLAIYFQSDRPGSESSDIWVSGRESVLAPWSPPVNVGAPINTGTGEFFPLIVFQGGTEWLYITRNVATPPSVELDLFVSRRPHTGGGPK